MATLNARMLTLAGVVAFATSAAHAAEGYVNAQLPWHTARLDAQGRLLAWYRPEANLGYDQFVRLGWDFLEHKVPIDPKTGLKIYLVAPIFDPATLQSVGRQHNALTVFAHLVESLVTWYPYSGDVEAAPVVRGMLDHLLAHGTSPADWVWPSVPFPTSCQGDKEYGRCIENMPADFFGGIEPDKVGEMGLSYVLFYELTGEKKYLDAGLKCADALAKHVRPGDAFHTPWPFRINARTGATLGKDEFGGLIVGPVRLFDELIRNDQGDAAAYRKARDVAWAWILNHPMNKSSSAWDKWTGYYEDVPRDTANQNDMNSIMTAHYILRQDDPARVDPMWKTRVGHLIDRSRIILGRGPFFGAWAIDEQTRLDARFHGHIPEDSPYEPGVMMLGTDGRGCCSRAGTSCRTAQWGAVNALFFERAGDGQAKEDAFRSLNYATYFAASDGKIACCGNDYHTPYWFEDGYADAGRSFLWAMGAAPDLAPTGQDHLLRSSSVVQKIKHGKQSVEYRTYHKSSAEVLRLTFKPTRVVAGGTALSLKNSAGTPDNGDGYTVESLGKGDFAVRIRHSQSNEIAIR